MTRFTNVGRKRTFLQAGFGDETASSAVEVQRFAPGVVEGTNYVSIKKKHHKDVALSENPEKATEKGVGTVANGEGDHKPPDLKAQWANDKKNKRGVILLSLSILDGWSDANNKLCQTASSNARCRQKSAVKEGYRPNLHQLLVLLVENRDMLPKTALRSDRVPTTM